MRTPTASRATSHGNDPKGRADVEHLPASDLPDATADDQLFYRALREGRDWAARRLEERITPIVRAKSYRGTSWEDVRQACLLSVLQAVRRTPQCASPWGLIRKIAICTIIDINRRQSLTRRVFREGPAGSAANGGEPDVASAVEARDPARSLDHAHADRQLYDYVVQALHEPCRRLFQMLFVEELTYPEAAAALKIREGALRVRLMRCREKALEIRKRAFETRGVG